MLALVVAQVVGQLTVDAAYARSVAVSRKLSDGFELRAGSKTSLRITVGVDVHVNHLVQLRVPSSTAESGEKLCGAALAWGHTSRVVVGVVQQLTWCPVWVHQRVCCPGGVLASPG